jgi:hypothetical protein
MTGVEVFSFVFVLYLELLKGISTWVRIGLQFKGFDE